MTERRAGRARLTSDGSDRQETVPLDASFYLAVRFPPRSAVDAVALCHLRSEARASWQAAICSLGSSQPARSTLGRRAGQHVVKLLKLVFYLFFRFSSLFSRHLVCASKTTSRFNYERLRVLHVVEFQISVQRLETPTS